MVSRVTSTLLSHFRLLQRDKTYVLIGLLSLSIGFAACLVLGSYARSEFSFDAHFSNASPIYRVAGRRVADNGDVYLSAPVSPLLGPYLESGFPQVQAFVRFDSAGGAFIESDGASYYWDRDTTFLTDINVFQVFDHEILAGNPETALLRPRSMAVSETFAKLYFGRPDVVGEVVKRRNVDYTINLVFADLPHNTHMKYDVLLAPDPGVEAVRRRAGGSRLSGIWLGTENPAYTYVVTPEGYDPNEFEEISNTIQVDFLSALLSRSGYEQHYYLEPLEDIHFQSVTERDFLRGNKFYPVAISAVALFVVLVAVVNFVILSTARNARRQRTVVVQRILGAGKGSIAVGLFGESFAICSVAILMGLVFVELAVSFLTTNNFVGQEMSFSEVMNLQSVMALVLMTVLVSLLAASYAVTDLVGKSVSDVFRGKRSPGNRSALGRHMLIGAQYLVSICFVTCAALMYLQMSFLTNKPLGFQTDSRLTMRIYQADNIDRLPAFINSLKQNPAIANATVSLELAGDVTQFNQTAIENSEYISETTGLYRAYIDENFVDTMDIELIVGENIDADMRTGGNTALVNETLVRQMGWIDPTSMRVQGLQVVGVVADFNFRGLQEEIAPLYMQHHMNYLDYGNESQRLGQIRMLTIQTSGANDAETLAFIRESWEAFFPSLVFEYEPLADSLSSLYEVEQQLLQLMQVLALFCAIVACLGQYSLTALTIEQRTKEFGIRRTLGATAVDVLILLTRSIVWVLLVAGVLASIFAFLAVNEWLNGFFYRVAINPFVFLAAFTMVGLLALVTTLIQSSRISVTNPVEALRYE